MSEHASAEERTEQPTEKRMGNFKREGQLFFSQDMAQVFTLGVAFTAISYFAASLGTTIQHVMIRAFNRIGDSTPFSVDDLHAGFILLMIWVGPAILLLMLLKVAAASLSVLIQTNWNKREKWIKFNWMFLNPIRGLQRIFSVEGLFKTFKAIVKLALIIPIAYAVLRDLAPEMVRLIQMPLNAIVEVATLGLSKVFWRIMYVLIALAILDYFWGKFQWMKNARMTKQEVKDERKAQDGDESTKRKIIAKGLKRIAQRIAQTVPKADVVITNPTHFAVAVKYERGRNAAPVVVAKGQDFLALKIREIALASGVPIIERKALARALYASTAVGKEIPRELFRAVAEVLAYVYRIKRPSIYSSYNGDGNR